MAPGARSERAWPGRAALGVAAAGSLGALARAPEEAVPWSLACLVVAFAGLGALVVVQRRRPTLGRAEVLAVSAVLVVVAVLVPPRRSTDVWAYASYGRMVAHHHVSPYTHAAEDFPGDPVSRRVAEVWQESPSVYGPAFVALSAGGMAAAGASPLAARLVFQGLAAASVLAALLMLDRRARDPMVLAFLGVNPLTVVSVVNGGHNDALVGLGVLAAVVLAWDRRVLAAGVAAGGAVLVKVGALVPVGALGLWLLAHQGLAAAALLAATTGGMAAGGYAAAGGGSALAPLGEASLRFTRGSVWWRVRSWVAAGGNLDAAGRWLSSVATVAVAAFAAALAAARRLLPSPAPAVAAGVLAYMLLGSYVAPWYVAWGLPLLALCWRSPLAWVAAGHAGLLLLTSMPRRIPDGEPLRGLVVWLYGAGLPMVEVALVAVLAWSAARALVRSGRPAGEREVDPRRPVAGAAAP